MIEKSERIVGRRHAETGQAEVGAPSQRVKRPCSGLEHSYAYIDNGTCEHTNESGGITILDTVQLSHGLRVRQAITPTSIAEMDMSMQGLSPLIGLSSLVGRHSGHAVPCSGGNPPNHPAAG